MAMRSEQSSNRLHEPSLREAVSLIDDLKAMVIEKDRSIRELMEERDHRYEDRFKGQETAVAAALAAQEKFNSAVSAASKEAILKAEASQIGVNERSNEFRGQLADQAATLMPRREAETSMLALRELIDREIRTLRIDIASLKDARNITAGHSEGLNAGWVLLLGAATLVGVAIAIIVAFRGGS